MCRLQIHSFPGAIVGSWLGIRLYSWFVFPNLYNKNAKYRSSEPARPMSKTLIFLWVILALGLAWNCQYSIESSCLSVGCKWINSTCSVGSGTCLTNFVWNNASNECVNCSALSSTDCTTTCATFYFPDTTQGCIPCTNIDPHCLKCNTTQCSQCDTGYTIDSNFPLECMATPCNIRHCTQCGTSTTCYSCQAGYKVTTDGLLCAIAICTIQNCLYCLSNTTCATCRDGYALSTSASSCSLICSDPYCAVCTKLASSCSSCVKGYDLSPTTGKCKLVCLVSFCTDCDLSTTCTVCATNYRVNTALSCSPVCTDANCNTCVDPTVCTACKTGYYLLSNSTCAAAICNVAGCLTCATALTCSTCKSIATLTTNGSLCVDNCLSVVAKCKSCLTNSTCEVCVAGYTLNPSTQVCDVVCNIQNCAMCLNSNLCQFCKQGYIVSSDYTACKFNCAVSSCTQCNSTTTCQTCATNYVLSASATACALTCSPGSYVSVVNGTSSCQLCSLSLTACSSCSPLANGTLTCFKCWDLYYLSGSGSCSLCNSTIANCLQCSSPLSCSQCNSTYILTTTATATACLLPGECLVDNCKICVSTNATKCSACHVAYEKTTDGSACTLIQCLSTQYFDTASLACVCPVGTYLSGGVCQYCTLDNCASCNSVGCFVCKSRYFASEGVCQPCGASCVTCSSASSCTECDYGFSLMNGQCQEATDLGKTAVDATVASTNMAEAICPPGCAVCGFSNNAIYCIEPNDGYSFDAEGNIVRCSTSCLSCATTDPEVCTDCFGASVLDGNTCTGCVDEYALTCPKDITYAITCINGYSAFNGTCKACAANCQTCGNAGPSNCDEGACNQGYVVLVDTFNCTRCYTGCATCHSKDPSKCLSCAGMDFLDNSSRCAPCPLVCSSCSSATVCTGCSSSYILQNNFCYTRLVFPCSAQNGSSCTACYLGYSLTNGNCVVDTSCNGTSTCITCPLFNYLKNKKCFSCSTNNAVCNFCDPKNPSSCMTCKTGYYLQGKSCKNCNTISGCVECSSKQKCTKTKAGYYLGLDDNGKYNGKAEKCSEKCATCSRATSCDTCIDGYTRFGSICLSSNNVQGSVTLGPLGTDAEDWFTKSVNNGTESLALGLARSNQFMVAILQTAGMTAADIEKVLLLSMGLGSLKLGFILGVPESSDPAAFASSFQDKLSKGQFEGFKLLKADTAYNGITNTSSSSGANLGLILGITIPLVVLLGVIIVFIKIYTSDGTTEDKETDDTNKDVQEFDL